jgi:hypothetical protein
VVTHVNPPTVANRVLRALVAGAGVAVAAYAAFAGITWLRYGEPTDAAPDEQDALLDRFMPRYEIVERHRIEVEAPAGVTLAVAKEQDLFRSGLVRAIVTTRRVILGGADDEAVRPRGLLSEMLSLGWGVLADEPGREVVVGAVTRPWEANVVFRPLQPEQFAAFEEAGFVKIVWTLRADPVDGASSIFRTETRAIATDPEAREKFRRYWSLVSPGVILIRRLSLAPLKREAERRARELRDAAAV